MSKKLYRWVCATCGAGANAPSRLAKNDTRRYCLDCSANSRLLVERAAPSLEKRRADRATRATERRQKVKQVTHESKYLVEGVDCLKLLKQCAVLPVYGGRKGRVYRRMKSKQLELVIHRCAKPPHTKYGHYSGDVHLFVWPGIHEASLRETILHELMHCAQHDWDCYRDACKIVHCRHFVAKMKVAWRQATRRFGEIAEAKQPGTKRHYLVNGSLGRCRECGFSLLDGKCPQANDGYHLTAVA